AMARFHDISIRSKLYGLTAFSTAGLIAVLGLSWWLLSAYRVNGPVYDHIMLRKDALAELEPATLYVLEPYVTLYQLSTTTDPEEVKRLTARFRKLQEVYR